MVKYTGFTGHYMIIQEIKGQKWRMIKYTGQTVNTGREVRSFIISLFLLFFLSFFSFHHFFPSSTSGSTFSLLVLFFLLLFSIISTSASVRSPEALSYRLERLQKL